jgi:hypothetical protein
MEALGRVIGVYSAMPGGPLALRVRARGIDGDDVRALETGRTAVRMRAMRTSAFLVPVATAALVAAATVVPASRFRWLLTAAGITDEALPEVRGALLAAATEPATPAELRGRLAAAGLDGAAAPWTRGAALGRVLSLLTGSGDLVAIGGSSLASNALRYVDRERWLGPPADVAPDPVVARAWLAGEYLRAFGPAREEDLAWWAGWTRHAAADALAAHDTVDVGNGLRLLAADLAAFETVEPLPPAITLLPKWDAWTMGYPLGGRARYLDPQVHDRVFDGDGNGLAMILRSGRAIGAWAHRAAGTTMEADLDLFEPVAAAERGAVDAELAAIGTFLGYRAVRAREVDTVIPNRRRQRRPLNPGAPDRVEEA